MPRRRVVRHLNAETGLKFMAKAELQVLYEDNHLLAVNKPPGLPTMGVAAGDVSLVTLAKQYIKRRYRKPGNVYIGVVSRLDTGTSGVVLLARTSKAAARLTELFKSRDIEKTYWAVVGGNVNPPEAELVDWVSKDERQQRMVVVAAEVSGAKEARLRYRVLRPVRGGTLLEINLLTGRKHQIRLQLAERGFPVWGESKYAQARAFGSGLALHARRLVLEHPVRHERLELVAPLPANWLELGIADLGG
jgi:23S rRNA pseudouridine1911/1915/1917 synthase